MKEQITGIVLGTVKHSDRYNVTGIYSRERGRMAMLTPAGSSKKSRLTAARLQPLSVVEAQVSVSASRELQIPSSITPVRVWRTLYFNPVKSTLTLFVSEFLSHLLIDAPSEPRLWDFIMDSIIYLDTCTHPSAIANFHIAFLIGMAHMTGIFPDISNYTEGMEFDMKGGLTVVPYSSQPSRGLRLDAKKTALLPTLLRMNYANSRRFRLNGKERSELLEVILRYFGCHFPGSDHLKSPEILKEIWR